MKSRSICAFVKTSVMWQPSFGDEDGEFCMVGTKHAAGSIDVLYWQELPEPPSVRVFDNE